MFRKTELLEIFLDLSKDICTEKNLTHVYELTHVFVLYRSIYKAIHTLIDIF